MPVCLKQAKKRCHYSWLISPSHYHTVARANSSVVILCISHYTQSQVLAREREARGCPSRPGADLRRNFRILPTPLIADFGLAREISKSNLRTFCGTVDYLPPELIASRHLQGGIREVLAGTWGNPQFLCVVALFPILNPTSPRLKPKVRSQFKQENLKKEMTRKANFECAIQLVKQDTSLRLCGPRMSLRNSPGSKQLQDVTNSVRTKKNKVLL
mmetsp:Transcript_34992/g.90652  ORF Transcript_34992/g.90652 Transcript_34992/m.90652 type:complete len:215 (+) Transcript_34992:859-1503(+)